MDNRAGTGQAQSNPLVESVSQGEVMRYVLERIHHTPQRPKGYGITAAELAAKLGCSIDTARRRLKALVEAGELHAEQMLDGRVIVTVFTVAKQREDDSQPKEVDRDV